MKIKKQIVLIACSFLLSQLFISCQKHNDITSNNINSTSIDHSIYNLPVDSSLVLWLTFRDGSLKDKSGQHNDVRFASATPASGKQGIDSTAYFFDGSSSYMTVKNKSSLSPVRSITLAALVKPMGFYQGLCHANKIINKELDDKSDGRYTLGFDDMKYYGYTGCKKPVKENRENFNGAYGNGRSSVTGVADTDYIKAGNWYNIVFTYNGSASNLYINNKLADFSTVSALFNPNSVDLYIGKTPDKNFPYYFNGIIDELRIYNRALSAEEVINLDNIMGKDN